MNLPSNWAECQVQDLAEVKGGKRLPKGKAFSEVPTGFPYIRVSDFSDGTVSTKDIRYLDQQTREYIAAYTISKQDLYVSIAGTIGLVGTIPDELDNANLTENAAKVCSISGVDRVFLSYLLRSKDSQDSFKEKTVSTTQPKLALYKIRELCLWLPPLAEQQQIAARLDALLAQVDTLKTRLDSIPAILKRFRQSVLAAAVSGRLTEEWRSDHGRKIPQSGSDVVALDSRFKADLIALQPALAKKKSSLQSDIDVEYVFDLPGSWVFSSWGKISEWITYGFTKPMPKSGEGKKLLTAKDVQFFKVDIDAAGLTTEQAFDGLSDKDRPEHGDLLITKDGSIGRAALVRTQESFCINQSVAVCWLRSTSMNKDFLELVANSDYSQKFVKDKAQGMAIQHLSIIDFAKCPVPVPPHAEQTEIVRRVEQLFAFTDQIEQRVKDAQSRVNHLTQSILAKAFRGELTAEWREQNPDLISGDNSAEALLERIKAERAAMVPRKGSRRKKADELQG